MEFDRYRELSEKCIRATVAFCESQLNATCPPAIFLLAETTEDTESVPLIAIDEFNEITFREGQIFRWIDLSVAYIENDCTIIHYRTSEDMVTKESETVYFSRNQGPFGIKCKSSPGVIVNNARRS